MRAREQSWVIAPLEGAIPEADALAVFRSMEAAKDRGARDRASDWRFLHSQTATSPGPIGVRDGSSKPDCPGS